MAATTYDSFRKRCGGPNGPEYFGVTLDPVTGVETLTQLNGDQWIAAGQSQGYESLSLCPGGHYHRITTYTYSKKKRKSGKLIAQPHNFTGNGIPEGKSKAMYIGGGALIGALALPLIAKLMKKKLAGSYNWIIGAAGGAGIGYLVMPKSDEVVEVSQQGG